MRFLGTGIGHCGQHVAPGVKPNPDDPPDFQTGVYFNDESDNDAEGSEIDEDSDIDDEEGIGFDDLDNDLDFGYGDL